MTNEVLRAFCLSLPGCTEDIKWEENLCFCVGEKIFCLTHFEEGGVTALKVSEEAFDELTAMDGIMQAPHFAKRMWVAIEERDALDDAAWKALIENSYKLVFASLTKKLQAEIGDRKG